jgi:hypothetical protein
MSSTLKISMQLFICKENIDINIIAEKMSSLVDGGIIIPRIKTEGTRDFDSRLQLGYCSYALADKQSHFDFAKQLRIWIDWLYPIRHDLRKLTHLGYFNILDIQISSNNKQLPSIQFSLVQEDLLKLSEMSIDINFTTYRF